VFQVVLVLGKVQLAEIDELPAAATSASVRAEVIESADSGPGVSR
jgi:hypothetical protein